MKLYMNTKEMEFDGIGYTIILKVKNTEFYGYDVMIELADDDKFITDTIKIVYEQKDSKDTDEVNYVAFLVREQDTFYNFPLYQIRNGKIESFDYTQFEYFANTKRRMRLGKRISGEYNQYTEAKTLRKTLKYIMDELDIIYPNNFKRYNDKIEVLINKNPKGEKNG